MLPNQTSKILQNLNDKQKEAVLSTARQLAILAGPGSGKTRVLCHRIAHLIANCGESPHKIVVVTFTNKAAQELKERLKSLLYDYGGAASALHVGTFHAVCASYLRKYGSCVGVLNNFGIADDDDSRAILTKVIKEMRLDKDLLIGEVKTYISQAKAQFIGVNEFEKANDIVDNQIMRSKVALVYGKYQNRLVRENLLDFDDILTFALKLFQQRPSIAESIEHILVDEYQDTNRVQFLIVREIAKCVARITVVGDPDQSIYGWRSADIRNILDFQQEFSGAQIVMLEQNYRSSSTILESSLRVIQHDTQRIKKGLWTENRLNIPVEIRRFDNAGGQEEFIANQSEYLVKNSNGLFNYNDIAILYRVNRDSDAVQQAFGMKGIGFRVIGGIRFFDRREVKDILCYLRLADNDHDSISFTRIVNVPGRGIGKAMMDKIVSDSKNNGISLFESFKTHVEGNAKMNGFVNVINHIQNCIKNNVGLAIIIEDIIEMTGYDDFLKSHYKKNFENRLESLEQLKKYATNFESKGHVELSPGKSEPGTPPQKDPKIAGDDEITAADDISVTRFLQSIGLYDSEADEEKAMVKNMSQKSP